MARLIIETHIRGAIHYHKIDHFPVTIGRAFDNDIILSDLSVSPHHLEINEDSSGKIMVINLSGENGTRIHKKEELRVGEGRLVSFPMHLMLGSSKIDLLSPAMPVEPTRTKECKGKFCIYTSPAWAAVLFIAVLGAFLLEPFLNTPVSKTLGHYINESFSSLLILFLIFLVIAGVSRLASHRWDIIPAVSIASLLFLFPQVVEYIGDWVNYYFSSDTFGNVVIQVVNFLLLPVLLTVFMIRIAHLPFVSALGIASLVSVPFIAWQASGLITQLTSPDFSKLPPYNKTLSSFDIRAQSAITVGEFIRDAEGYLNKQVIEELEVSTTESN